MKKITFPLIILLCLFSCSQRHKFLLEGQSFYSIKLSSKLEFKPGNRLVVSQFSGPQAYLNITNSQEYTFEVKNDTLLISGGNLPMRKVHFVYQNDSILWLNDTLLYLPIHEYSK